MALIEFLKEALSGQIQKDVAGEIGISVWSLNRIMTGHSKPTVEQVCRFAAHVGEAPYRLFEMMGDLSNAALFNRLAFPSAGACRGKSGALAIRLRRLILRGLEPQIEGLVGHWEGLWSAKEPEFLSMAGGSKKACLLATYREVACDVIYSKGMPDEEAEFLASRLPAEGWDMFEHQSSTGLGLTLALSESDKRPSVEEVRTGLAVWSAAFSLLLRL